MSAAGILVQVLTVLLVPPLLLGIIQRTRARFAGRQGPPLLQPWLDIAKLLAKGSVWSRTTTWVFRAGPVTGLAALLVAALLVPVGPRPSLLSFEGDFVLFLYLFALVRFFTVLAALDTGSAFEGMGAARDATFSALTEPALLLGLLSLVLRSGALTLSGLLGSGRPEVWSHASAALVLVGVSWFVVTLAEACRVPFDDPTTHLELTMVHEVMVLDHGGPALGLILYAQALKLFLLGALVVRVALPLGAVPVATGWVLFFTGMFLLYVLIGVVESVMARLRLVEVPRLLVAASILSAFGILLQAR